MIDNYVPEYQEPRERWLHGYFNWTEEKDITKAERHTARDGFDAGANWAEKQRQADIQEIRYQAWKEYNERREKGYTEGQLKTFMAGMCVMWRLCKVENRPLFTYGPDSKPKE